MTTVPQLVQSLRDLQKRRAATDQAYMTEMEQILSAALVTVAPPSPLPTPAVTRRGILVPAYFSPSSGSAFWSSLISAAAKVPVVAIANPNSGPGSTRDLRYTDVIARAVAAGVRVIGYVSTDYGKRDPRVVNSDVSLWRTLYPQISGIFFDEMATDTSHVAQYQGFVDVVRITPGSLVVLNAGTTCDIGYVTVARPDVIVMSERAGTVKSLPTWSVSTAGVAFASLVYAVDEAVMKTVVAQMPADGYSWTYVTDDTLAGNPWNSLPSYWTSMVAEMSR